MYLTLPRANHFPRMEFKSDGNYDKAFTQTELLESSIGVLSKITSRYEELDDALFTLNSTKKEIEGQIGQCFQTIFRGLEKRRKVLLKDLDDSIQKRRIIIKNMMKNFEERRQKITMNIECLKHLQGMENGKLDVSKIKNNIGEEKSNLRQVSEEQLGMLSQLPIPMYPSSADILSYFPIDLDHLLCLIKRFGAIGITNIDSDQTSLDSYKQEDTEQVIRCFVNEEILQNVYAVDFQGNSVDSLNPEEFSVSLTTRLPKANEASITFDRKNSHDVIGIKLKLFYPGKYDLNIKILGEHIRGSPYRLNCHQTPGPFAKEWKRVFKEISEKTELRWGAFKFLRRSNSATELPKTILPPTALADQLDWNKNSLIFTIGTRGKENSEFGLPQGIMITRDEKIVVADSNNANIQVFEIDGAFRTRFGDFGTKPGELIRPKDIAETINSNYLICDFDSHCIHVFQPTGNYMSRFGQKNLAGPNGVAVDSRGKIFVTDLKACTVCYFKPTGRFLGHFGSRGIGDNKFTAPVSIAIDSADRVFVIDSPIHCIKVFDNDGEFLFKFGMNGVEPGCLHMPTYLCFDANDVLYITDTGNNRIQAFDKEGNFLHLLKTPLDSLNTPHGIAVSSSQEIIVIVDAGNFRIKAFQQPKVLTKNYIDTGALETDECENN